MIFARKVPSEARSAYRLDAWSAILTGVYTGSIIPFYLVVARDKLHASPMLVALIVASPFAGNLFSLLWAHLMEGRHKMPFATVPWLVGRGFLVAVALTTTPVPYSLIISLSMLITTASSPAYAAIMKDVYPDRQRGRIMGYARVLLAFFQIAATFISGILLKVVGYRIIFPIGALFGVASALVFGRIKTSPPAKSEIAGRTGFWRFLVSAFRILRDDHGFRWFALSVVVFGFGSIAVSPLYPIFQVDRLHISYSQVAVLTSVTNIVWMVSFIFWGRYIEKYGSLQATVITVMLAILCPMNYFIAGLFSHPNFLMLIPSAVLFGVTNAGIELAYFNTVLDFSDETTTSRYQALFAFLLGSRGMVAPFVGAAVMDALEMHNIDTINVFAFAAVIMLIGAFMQVIGLRRSASRKSK